MHARSSRQPDSAGLYVHVPFCQSKCPYCAFYSEPLSGRDPARLLEAVLLEIDRYALPASVHTIYLGGGSPTCLPAPLLSRLLKAIAGRCPNASEFTVECNPAQVNADALSLLRDAGVNRLSLGAQSFNDRELALLGRRHSAADAIRAVESARAVGFENVSLDLMFAVPGSSLKAWKHTLESAVALNVQHISAYALTFEEGTPFDSRRRCGQLTSADEQTDRAMYEFAIDFLAAAGFRQYEISNFARDGCACAHNQLYWENRPCIGVGPSAGSYWRGRRTLNVADIDLYVRAIEAGCSPHALCERPNRNERICETAILNLRMRRGIDRNQFCNETGADFFSVFNNAWTQNNALGLMETDGGTVRLTRQALPVADGVLCDFSTF